jgi:hypothetical protein
MTARSRPAHPPSAVHPGSCAWPADTKMPASRPGPRRLPRHAESPDLDSRVSIGIQADTRAERRLSQVHLPKVLVEPDFYGVDMSPREHLALTADLVHGDRLHCSP